VPERVGGRIATSPSGLVLGSCLAIAIAIASGVPPTATAQESLVLRLAPPLGQVSHYRYQVQTWLPVLGLPAADSTSPSMRLTFNVTQTVVRADSGISELRASYDSVGFEAPMMGAMAQPMAQQAEQSLRGLVVTTRVDVRGRVLSTTMTGGPSTTGPFSPSMGSRQIQLPVLPHGPVTVGAIWTDSQTVSSSAGAQEVRSTLRMTYRLERLDPHGDGFYAVIRGTGTVASAAAGTSMSASGSVANEIVLDLAVGRLVRATSATEITTDLSPGGQRIPLRLTASGVLVDQPEGSR
jgi:hypothetical protein